MSETALITGASSGIGLEFAKLFASDGSNLILVSRDESRLSALRQQLVDEHSVHVEIIAMDLAQIDAVERLLDEISRQNLLVDVLVNNAGFGDVGRFVELSTQRQLEMIQLNVVAVTQLTRLLLPEMIKHDRGGVLNVASTAAFQPGPNMAIYYATKAFVLSFSEALHEELIATNLHVTCLCPGPTATGFAGKSGLDSTRLFESGVMDAHRVATIGYRAFRRNRAIVVAGFKNKLLAMLTRIAPRILTRKLVKRLQSSDSHTA